MKKEGKHLFPSVFVCLLLVYTCSSDVKYYTNKWLVHVPYGEQAAREVSRSLNMIYEGPEDDIDGFYRMSKSDILSKSFEHNDFITEQLNNHDLVTTASQEAVKARSQRSIIQPRHVVPRSTLSNYRNAFNDQRWPEMWYFQDFRDNPKQPVLDMNLVPVYYDLKITGKYVNVTVPDDGLEWTHPEIISNFNPNLSWNYINNNDDILPDKDILGDYKSHGTRCAGEIIMQPNNGICGVGTAYGASIGGIKFLDEKSTDAREAKVLKYALQYACIYSNSWGPADTGTYMEHLTDLVKRSLSKGIHEGRNGKGAIYVFAAGNGKGDGDNCACDGFVNSIYTVVIASCDDSGHVTHYSERCASIIATAYSGSGLMKNVLTADVNGKCTNQHTGTSAAAPLVSGIIALALSANPKLTWRDVQYLIVWTSQIAPLSDNFGWNRNKAGFFYSMDFGFGLVNAYKLVLAAQKWINVPEMSSCGIRIPSVKNFPVTRNRAARIIVYSKGCEGLSGEINYIEFVQLVVTMSYPKRGDIQVSMKSPSGTEIHILESRPNDFNTEGLKRWTFSVLAFWGESPKGYFTIDIFDTTGESSNSGLISEMTLSIHGVKKMPNIYKEGPRPYDAFNLAKSGDPPRFVELSSKNTRNLKNIVNENSNVAKIKNEINDGLDQNIQNAILNIEKNTSNQEEKIIQNIVSTTVSAEETDSFIDPYIL